MFILRYQLVNVGINVNDSIQNVADVIHVNEYRSVFSYLEDLIYGYVEIIQYS